MAKKFLTPLDMTGLEIQNFRVQNNNGIPSTNVSEGRLIFNSSSSSKKLTYYNGTQWVEVGTGPTYDALTSSEITAGTSTTNKVVSGKTIYDGMANTIELGYSNGTRELSIGNEGNDDQWDSVTLPEASTSTPGLMSSSDKTKLNGIATGAEVNVQSDWNQTTNTEDDYIKNKPTIGSAAAKGVDTSIGSSPTDNNVPTSAAVASYVSTAVGAVDAMRFKGTIGTGGDVSQLPTSGVKVGDTYRVITAGTYAGQTCEVGDLIIAIATTPTWTVAQTNIDGAITAAGTGLSKSGSTINHSNSVTAKTTQALYPIAFDAQGHITGSGTAITNATTSTAGLMSATDKAFLDDLETSGFLEFGKHTFNSSVLGTSTTISKNVLAYSAYDNVTKEEVVLDVEKSGTNSTTFSVAQAYSNAIVIYYVYTEASL